MKIREYLQKKYGRDSAFGLLAAEAKVLGIIYPLRKGWLEACQENEISADQRTRLIKALKSSKSEYAQAAIAALYGGIVKDAAPAPDANAIDAARWRHFRECCTSDMLDAIDMAFNAKEIDAIIDADRCKPSGMLS